MQRFSRSFQNVWNGISGFPVAPVSFLVAVSIAGPLFVQNPGYSNPGYSNPGYWNDVERTFARTQLNHVAAVAAHNCYVDSAPNNAENLARTIDKIHSAQSSGADLIELDIRSTGNQFYVAHDDDDNLKCAKLSDALMDPGLKSGDQVLYLEIKEEHPTLAQARQLLDIVRTADVAHAGRPVVFRAFDNRRNNLTLIQEAMETPEFQSLRQHVKFHEFIRAIGGENGNALVHSRILRAKNSGFDGVEFRYDMPNVYASIAYAKSIGLGVGLFTIPVRFGEVFVSALREDVDALVVDYPIKKSRAIVESKNGLIYFNACGLAPGAKDISYSSSRFHDRSLELQSPGAPRLESANAGGSQYGTTMHFNGSQWVTLFDANNLELEGYLVTANVRFDDLDLVEGQTRTVVAKSDNGGFALELHRPAGSHSTMLRFGVRVGSDYRYAAWPAKSLNVSESYFIVGAYDGDGGVRIWVNGESESTDVDSAVGGVRRNDSPVVIGADPQGPIGRRFYFRGSIQQVQVQRWGQH